MDSETKNLIRLALKEDAPKGDITSKYLIPSNKRSRAVIVAREDGIVCGVNIAKKTFRLVDQDLKVAIRKRDGKSIKKGDIILIVDGNLRSILLAERVALNFLTHLSGVSTLTSKFVEAVKGTRAQIFSTRKTLPGFRQIQKDAVECGGGEKHRMNLSDQVLIKTNHLRMLAKQGLLLKDVIKKIRKHYGRKMKIEVEVDTLVTFQRILLLDVDMIMFDNMSPNQIRKGVLIAESKKGKKPLLEVSGGITLNTVKQYAQTGVDRISVGSLTHSVPALDIALEVR